MVETEPIDNELREKLLRLRNVDSKNWYNPATHRETYQKDLSELLNLCPKKTRVREREFLYILNINHEIVPRRLANYCKYVGNKYVGVVYLDVHGNIYKTADEAVARCGSDAVFTCADGNYIGTKCSEAVYIPEMRAVLIETSATYPHINVSHVNDNNEYLSHLGTQNTLSYIIDDELMVYTNNCWPKHISDCYVEENKVDGLMDAIKSLIGLPVGVVNVGGNTYIPLDTMANLKTFTQYKAKLEYKSGKIQKKIDELVEAKKFECKPATERMPHEYENLTCKTRLNKIDENRSVIRWTYSYRDESFDGMRIYVDGKDVYACKSNNKGQYIKVALSVLNQKNFAAEYNSDIEIDDMSGTRLEWYSSIINTLPATHRITLLTLFLTDVKIEQLVKLGFGDSICHLMENIRGNIGPILRSKLNVNSEFEDSKNLYHWLGLNKYQLEKIKKYCVRSATETDLITGIADMKIMFCSSDISAYDNKLFDAMMSAYEARENTNSWTRQNPHFVSRLVNLAERDDTTGVFKANMLKYAPQLLTMANWDQRTTNIYYDYIDMVCKMGIRSSVKLYPTTSDELKTMHDNALVVFNMRRSQYQRDAFIKRVDEWKKFEYENEDFDFCVVAPTVPEDLVVEGVQLHHCVRSYIDRVANGSTNILFIRKKDERNTPFFTVELSNDRTIRQVHGSSNRNADTEDGMEEFIHRWARNKRLKLGGFNAVRG